LNWQSAVRLQDKASHLRAIRDGAIGKTDSPAIYVGVEEN
jgi:hypothetical protein